MTYCGYYIKASPSKPLYVYEFRSHCDAAILIYIQGVIAVHQSGVFLTGPRKGFGARPIAKNATRFGATRALRAAHECRMGLTVGRTNF